MPELKPWMVIAAGVAGIIALAWATGGAKAEIKIGEPSDDLGMVPWVSTDHCDITWPRRGRHSHTYPAQVGPHVGGLMAGAPLTCGMGLTSWMMAPPSEETT